VSDCPRTGCTKESEWLFGFHYIQILKKYGFLCPAYLKFSRLRCYNGVGNRKSVQKLSVRKILMNWKTLLLIASLSLSIGLTACNKQAATPDATKTEVKTETTTETKPGDAPKGDAMKPAAAPKGDAMKPTDAAPKGDTTKTTKTETTQTKPADAPKKP
jgi:hypothetical protein